MFLIPPRGPKESLAFCWRPLLRIGLVALGAILLVVGYVVGWWLQ
jgi:hypothetical protein